MIPENDWYGHKRVLADYCGLDDSPEFHALLWHGWAPDLLPGEGHRRLKFAPWLVWNTRLRDQARASGVPNVHCVGAPFSYLVRMRYADRSTGTGTGTIAFPAHSTDGPPISYQVGAFIERVQSSLPGPYTVSVYYLDIGTPAARAYEQAGWRVVTFGSRTSTDFLYRLAECMWEHHAVVSNVAQTSVWYGALLGKDSRVLGDGAEPVDPGQRPDKALARWPVLAGGIGTRPELLRVAEDELGFRETLEPAELRAFLGLDSWRLRMTARAVRRVVDERHRREARRAGARIEGLAGDAALPVRRFT